MENLKVYQKMYDFAIYVFPIVDRFPRQEKFALCTNIKNAVLEIVRLIIRANKSYNKKPIIHDVDTRLEELKFLLRFAHNRKYLSHKSYCHSAELLSEIGKMIGGWLKNV